MIILQSSVVRTKTPLKITLAASSNFTEVDKPDALEKLSATVFYYAIPWKTELVFVGIL